MSGEEIKCEVIDWEAFYDLAKRTAMKIQAAGYRPDLVIGLTTGGWVPARVLGDLLGVKNMVSLKAEHWWTTTPDVEVRLKYPFQKDLSGRHVLVVDDIIDSEDGMRMATDYVRTLKPAEIRTATLFHIKDSNFAPDFYGDEVTRRRAIFPWTYTEDVCCIVPKVADSCADLDEMRRRIQRDYGIDIDEQRLSWILNELDRRSRG